MADSTTDPKENYWLPLESDPTLLTDYLRALTLSNRYLVDVPSIDLVDEMGIFEFNDVIAYIFLFPVSEKHGNLGQVETDPERIRNLYYMKQLIYNSCGSVALVHAFLNTIPPEKLTKDSVLQQFYQATRDMTPEERGKAFAERRSSEHPIMHQLHHDAALQGQSQLPTVDQLPLVDYHFVAFVPHNGFIYELDGRRDGPVNHGPANDQTDKCFKREALNVIKKYMALDPENLNFSVLALCA